MPLPASVVVREASETDIAEIVVLSADARASTASVTGLEPTTDDELRGHLSLYMAAGGSVWAADLDGRVVGFALARTVGPHLFAEAPGIVIDTIFVDPAARRAGVGHALVARVAQAAGDVGAPFVYGTPQAGSRTMQRFLARLGFAPSLGYRVVPTASLAARLNPAPVTGAIDASAVAAMTGGA
ncbi:MAG: GNAT family N-acetyltransferase, partial [Cellulomonadaceae bacterium]|nr:GNAT family N-acetyltransferase [Cellulomonadaceae bacterium]